MFEKRKPERAHRCPSRDWHGLDRRHEANDAGRGFRARLLCSGAHTHGRQDRSTACHSTANPPPKHKVRAGHWKVHEVSSSYLDAIQKNVKIKQS